MRIRNLLALVLACFMLVTVFTGCTPRGENPSGPASENVGSPAPADPDKTYEITIWTHESTSQRVAAWNYVISAFQKEHPNIKVTNEVVLWDDFQSKFLNAIQTHTAPDIVAVTGTTWASGYQVGGLIPVDGILNSLDVNIYESLLDGYRTGGNCYAIPFANNVEMLFYRPSMLEAANVEVPTTWDKLLAAAEKLTIDKDNDGTIDQYGIGISTSRSDLCQNTLAAFACTTGTDYFDADGNVTFNSDEIVSAIQLYADLAKYTPDASSGWSWGEIEMNWAAGSFALFPYCSPNLSALLEAGDTDIACAPLPSPDGKNNGHSDMVHSLAVTKDCETKGNFDAVATFLQFIMKPEMAYVLTVCQEPGLYFPTSQEANALLESGYYNEDAFPIKNWDFSEGSVMQNIIANINAAAAQSIETAYAPAHKHGAVCLNFASMYGSQVFADVMQRVIINNESAQDAAAWGQAQLEEMAAE